MTKHRRNGYENFSAINDTALPCVPFRLRQAKVGIVFSTVLVAGVMMVHASTSAPSFRVSKPIQPESRKSDGIVSKKLLALNVGGSTGNSVVQSQQLQPYPYKDEDFVIPTMKEQPRYIQRFTNPQKATHRDRSMTTSSTHWIAVAITAISFSKALYHKLTNYTNSLRPSTAIGDDDGNDNDFNTIFESTSVEGDIDVDSSMTDHQSADSSTIPPEWKEQYDHLIVEATSLREQLSVIQHMLEKQQSEPLEAAVSSPELLDDNGDIQSSDTADETAALEAEIQSLKESVQYWKRVAEMNEQQISNAIQVERQNCIRQLEQLKTEMLEMVNQERTTLMKEYTSMIQELRDSLNSQTEGNT